MDDINMDEAPVRAAKPEGTVQARERRRYEAPRLLGYGTVNERTGDQHLNFSSFASSA